MRFVLLSFAAFSFLFGNVKAQEAPLNQKKDIDNCKQKIVEYVAFLNSDLKNSTINVDFSDANFIYYKYNQLKDYGFEGFDKVANSKNKFMTIFLFSSQQSTVGEISQEAEQSYICEILNSVNENTVVLYPLLQDKTLVYNFDSSVSLKDIGTDLNTIQNNKSDVDENYDIDFRFDNSGKVDGEKSDVSVVDPNLTVSPTNTQTTQGNSSDTSAITSNTNNVDATSDTSNNLN